MSDHANARPTKRFFIDMLTADISLEDALLDLIDNSVDAIVQLHNLPLDMTLIASDGRATRVGRIDVNVSADAISVIDDGRGIEYEDALRSVFRLGRPGVVEGTTLGVFGIGMKRALFKLGNRFEVNSRAAGEPGFCVSLPDVEAWASNDPDEVDPNGDDPWSLPAVQLPDSTELRGTVVSITELRQEIATRLRDPSVLLRIRDQIGRTYSLILGRYLSVYLNEELVEPIAVPIGSSDALDRAVQHLSLDNGTVKATVVAGVADRDHQNQQDAGWYVLCNGRAIVWADKTTMTGWGDGVPQFVPSFRSFVGVVLFFSAHPALLPWQTTKRGLNQDSLVYLQARPVMRAIARPVLDYLRTLYYDSGEEMVKERQQLDNVKPVQMSSLGEAPARTFQATAAARVKKSDVVSVQFDATRDEIARAGRILGEPGESARRIARAALDFVLDEPGE